MERDAGVEEEGDERGSERWSRRSTEREEDASRRARRHPEGPAPTMTTSKQDGRVDMAMSFCVVV